MLESFLSRRGAVCVAMFALVYYGLYFNADLTLTGEAGSNVLIAQRILEGWRPIKDMFIGYNLMWFYPLAWIFELTGPHLLASRIYFMFLSGSTGLLGFLLVRKITGRSTLAAIAAGMMILMPGAMYRNNVGFVATLASFALVYGYVVPHSSRLSSILWMGFSGAAMSLCFLIRIEPSLIASVVWLGLAVLYPIGVCGAFGARLKVAIIGTVLGFAMFALVHAPFAIHAHREGFGQEFSRQYSQFVKLFDRELRREIQKLKPSVAIAHQHQKEENQIEIQPDGPSRHRPVQTPSVKPSTSEDGRRPRASFSESFKNGRISFFPLSMYFPILSAGVLVFSGVAFFLVGSISGCERDRLAGLGIFATTGCALSLFPQYFFFRPDSVHLAEFMVPFYPALGCASAAGLRIMQERRLVAWDGMLLVAVAGLQAVVAFNALFGREGSGSIRMARGKTALFEAPGGISFMVRPGDLPDWEGLRDLLASSTEDGDYLITFPYVPVLNVMAGRPSYQFKLYVDNATEGTDFSDKTILELQEKKPAVVVVNNRAINKTEFSRFQNWAAPVYQYLQQEYVPGGTYLENIEVFIRPDRAIKKAH